MEEQRAPQSQVVATPLAQAQAQAHASPMSRRRKKNMGQDLRMDLDIDDMDESAEGPCDGQRTPTPAAATAAAGVTKKTETAGKGRDIDIDIDIDDMDDVAEGSRVSVAGPAQIAEADSPSSVTTEHVSGSRPEHNQCPTPDLSPAVNGSAKDAEAAAGAGARARELVTTPSGHLVEEPDFTSPRNGNDSKRTQRQRHAAAYSNDEEEEDEEGEDEDDSSDSAFGESGTQLSELRRRGPRIVYSGHKYSGNDSRRLHQDEMQRKHDYSDKSATGSDCSNTDTDTDTEPEEFEYLLDGMLIQLHPGQLDSRMVMSSEFYVTVLNEMLQLRAMLMLRG